jgi:hypothetical protein
MRIRVLNAVATALATSLVSSHLAAQPLVVAGSPGYDLMSHTGFKDAYFPFPNPSGSCVNSSGIAVVYEDKYVAGNSKGRFAVRWGASGAAATELGNLGSNSSGIGEAEPSAVNDAGTAVGYSRKYVSGSDKGTRAVRWGASGTAATELGNLGVDPSGITNAWSFAVNSAGTAVGYSEKYVSGNDLGRCAVRWDAGDTVATELDSLGTDSGGATDAEAFAVNDAGTAVGASYKYISGNLAGERAVRWDASGTAATELDNLGTISNNFRQSEALAVNSAGTAVGYSDTWVADSELGRRAVRWDASGTAATELGNLGTDSSGSTDSAALAVNSAGVVMGWADKFVSGVGKGERAVRWNPSGTAAIELENLGTNSSGVTSTLATDMNEAGIAVGFAEKYVAGSSVGNRAVVWLPDGSVIDLNDLGVVANSLDGTWLLNKALAISDNGWVAGIGEFTPTVGQPYTRGWVAQLNLLPGDYNGNGIVDAADYTVWRDHLGQNYSLQNRDPSASGPIGASDYAYWVAHFGQSGSGLVAATAATHFVGTPAGSGTHGAVPEPGAMLLTIAATIGCSALKSSRRGR